MKVSEILKALDLTKVAAAASGAALTAGGTHYGLTSMQGVAVPRVSGQFALTTFMALLGLQLTGKVERIVRGAADIDEGAYSFSKFVKDATGVVVRCVVALLMAEAGKAMFYKPGQTTEGFELDVPGFLSILAQAVPTAVISSRALRAYPNFKDWVPGFLEVIAIAVGGTLALGAVSGAGPDAVYPLTVGFAAAVSVATMMWMVFNSCSKSKTPAAYAPLSDADGADDERRDSVASARPPAPATQYSMPLLHHAADGAAVPVVAGSIPSAAV